MVARFQGRYLNPHAGFLIGRHPAKHKSENKFIIRSTKLGSDRESASWGTGKTKCGDMKTYSPVGGGGSQIGQSFSPVWPRIFGHESLATNLLATNLRPGHDSFAGAEPDSLSDGSRTVIM
jgi:hypothetical protein